jgi:hypothetical protein
MSLLNSKILKKLTLGLVGIACYSALSVYACSSCDSLENTRPPASENEFVSTTLDEQLLQEQDNATIVVTAETSIVTELYFNEETGTEITND